MPKNSNTRTSRKTRKNLLQRKNRKKQGRAGRRRPEPNAPAIIANSLFALTLNPVPGVVVESNKSLQNGAFKIYDDLLLCLNKIISSSGEIPKLPADDLPIERKLDALMGLIKRALKLEFNVELIEKKFCVVVYHKCDYVNYLPAFQVGPSLLKVKKQNPRIHDLFVSFLKTFVSVACVDTWFDFAFENSREYLKDTIWQYENDGDYRQDIDPDWMDEAKKDLEEYETGLPTVYQKLLRRTKNPKSAADLLKSANRFKAKHPLLKLIRKGCEVLDPRFSMWKYNYNPDIDNQDEDNRDGYSLEFINQAMICWKYGGPVDDEYNSWIDSHANEAGVDLPICKSVIHPNKNGRFNKEEFIEMCLWPSRLAEFFSDANHILNNYKLK